MKKLTLFFLLFTLLSPKNSFAQIKNNATPLQTTYVKGEVVTIKNEGAREISGVKNLFQDVRIRISEGSQKNKEVQFEYGGNVSLTASQKVRGGETVILAITKDAKGVTTYAITDRYRTPQLLFIVLLFFIFVLIMAGKKGAGSIAGLLISLGVILWFIVPMILAGHDPLLISIIGSIFILTTTMFLAHGFTQRTTIAVIATALSLILTGLFAIGFVTLTHLSGLGSEDIYSLQQGFLGSINFQGLLLGGIIIGALGVLDDVTTTQAATVFTLAEADKKLKPLTLFKQGMIVGREHITSVVNTLVLAYAGASIGVFIFLSLAIKNNTQPLWVILNSEAIVEEVVRSLAGSMGLILAVPLTTIIAAVLSRYSLSIK